MTWESILKGYFKREMGKLMDDLLDGKITEEEYKKKLEELQKIL